MGYRLTENIKAVIFDLDGSLMDSMWIWKQIDIEYLAGFGIPLPGGLQESIGGLSMPETADYFKKRFGIQDDPEVMMDQWNRMAWDKYTHEVFPKKGAEVLLAHCKANGIPMAIASSNSKVLVHRVLQRCGIDDYFACILTGDDVRHGKPAPDIYLKAAGELHTKPSACLVFEDIIPGITAARAAGMTVVAVYDDLSKDTDEQKRAMTDGYIRDFTEVEFS